MCQMTKAKPKKKIGIKTYPSSVIALKLVLLRHNIVIFRCNIRYVILSFEQLRHFIYYLFIYNLWRHPFFLLLTPS